MAATFDFKAKGETATESTDARQGTVDRYLRLALEQRSGEQNEGVRLALYFARKAPNVSSTLGIMADKALLKVMQTALNMPAETALMSLDKQVEMYSKRVNVANFKDPKKLESFITRFTSMWEAQQRRRVASRGSDRITHLGKASRRHLDRRSRQPATSQARRPLMQPSLYVSLSGQMATMRRLETLAHNVANVTTAGFRAEEIKFDELLSQKTDQPTAFVSAAKTYISREQGELVQTDNKLDVAVTGDAWLAISAPGGRTAYTRDGRMTMTPEGELRTLTGYSHPRRRRRTDPAQSDGRRAQHRARRHAHAGRPAARRHWASSLSRRKPTSLASRTPA